MDYEDLMGLIDRIDQSALSYLDYKTDLHHLILSKKMPQLNTQLESSQLGQSTEPIQQSDLEKSEKRNETSLVESESVTEEETGEIIKSPMIGVAYLQANPDEDPYVKVGDRVEEGDTICIIEAMKLMNEIKAPESGLVTEILIEDEEIVEFNQSLIRIKK